MSSLADSRVATKGGTDRTYIWFDHLKKKPELDTVRQLTLKLTMFSEGYWPTIAIVTHSSL